MRAEAAAAGQVGRPALALPWEAADAVERLRAATG